LNYKLRRTIGFANRPSSIRLCERSEAIQTSRPSLRETERSGMTKPHLRVVKQSRKVNRTATLLDRFAKRSRRREAGSRRRSAIAPLLAKTTDAKRPSLRAKRSNPDFPSSRGVLDDAIQSTCSASRLYKRLSKAQTNFEKI